MIITITLVTWAVHCGLLGKFKEGVTMPDPKTWKANFRCAMNSLPDIEEVKDKSINKGCGAVRVYRMMPAVTKKKDKRSKSRDSRRRMKVRMFYCFRCCQCGVIKKIDPSVILKAKRYVFVFCVFRSKRKRWRPTLSHPWKRKELPRKTPSTAPRIQVWVFKL